MVKAPTTGQKTNQKRPKRITSKGKSSTKVKQGDKKTIGKIRQVIKPLPEHHVPDIVKHPLVARIFASLSLLCLLATTVYWSILSARIMRFNSDQLVDAYMLSSTQTFNASLFPGAHTQLVKWPLFWLVKLMGFSQISFIATTVVITLLTVSILAYIIHKIDRRAYVFGILCLILTATLLMIPTESYSGALLPVNFAMLTTRNIEYAIYLWCIYSVVKAKRYRSAQIYTSIAGLAVLIASDKIFGVMSLGSSLLGLPLYLLVRNSVVAKIIKKWLVVSTLAFVLSSIVLFLVNTTGLTNVVSDSSVTPFNISTNISHISLGAIYSTFSLLTNFGANPAHGVLIIRDLPKAFVNGLVGESGPVYILNIASFLAMSFMTLKIFFESLRRRNTDDVWSSLSIILTLSTVVAIAAYIFTEHYYAVDARYLTISLFALMIGGGVYLRRNPPNHRIIAITACFVAAMIPIAVAHSYFSYKNDQLTYSERDRRNKNIISIISQRHNSLIVGDYWQVVPLKSYVPDNKLTVSPLSSCTTSRDILTSKIWHPDLHKHAFAYLATRSPGTNMYNGCPIDQIIEHYGHPNETVVIAGSAKQPDEMLMFYDQGIQDPHKSTKSQFTFPSPISQLTTTKCPSGSVLETVAHQDDGILFMNPDTKRSLDENKCLNVVFLTAGDAGGDQSYWYGRESGAKYAYSVMAGTDNIWTQKTLVVDNKLVSVATLKGNPMVQLVFMRLPDGGQSGWGFTERNYASLASLNSGRLSSLQTVDGHSVYTKSGLINVIAELMIAFKPTEIKTQTPYDAGKMTHDHSDHIETGKFTLMAYEQYTNKETTPIYTYLGYPSSELPTNVSGDDLRTKESIFFAYANFDGAVCRSIESCGYTVYSKYLDRQYLDGTNAVPSE